MRFTSSVLLLCVAVLLVLPAITVVPGEAGLPAGHQVLCTLDVCNLGTPFDGEAAQGATVIQAPVSPLHVLPLISVFDDDPLLYTGPFSSISSPPPTA